MTSGDRNSTGSTRGGNPERSARESATWEVAELRDAGYHVWPFDAPAYPLLIEIYPRILTGPVTKSNPVARGRYAHDLAPDLEMDDLFAIAGSEDAFDAAVSALVMARHQGSFERLPPARTRKEELEDRIWTP